MTNLFLLRNGLSGDTQKRKKKRRRRGNQKKRKIRLMGWFGQIISLVTLFLQLVEMTNCKWLTIKVLLVVDLTRVICFCYTKQILQTNNIKMIKKHVLTVKKKKKILSAC